MAGLLLTKAKDYKPLASRGHEMLLKRTHTKQATRRDYTRRLGAFLEFASRHGLEVNSRRALDCALADYMDLQCLKGQPGDGGRKLLAALRHARPKLGRAAGNQLPRFLKAAHKWGRAAPGQSKDPMPAVVRSGVEAALIHRGYRDEAAFVALAFECYLRFSERFELAPSERARPGEAPRAPRALLAGANPAQRARDPDEGWDVRRRDPDRSTGRRVLEHGLGTDCRAANSAVALYATGEPVEMQQSHGEGYWRCS